MRVKMRSVIDLFKTIATIPHCSRNTNQLKDYIEELCARNGASVITDDAGNILATLGDPVICMQAHYDMVCVGNYRAMDIQEIDGYIRAKDSSLGADNGVGVAIMLDAINRKVAGEYLFTNDEEIGLIGAINLKLTLQSHYILNLDGEDDGHVIVGCSGGVVCHATYPVNHEVISGIREFYKVLTINLPGGHSGIDISKEIPNGIKEVADFLMTNEDHIDLIEFQGGERFNAIPTDAYAIFGRKPGQKLTVNASNLKFDKLDQHFTQKIKDQDRIIHTVNGFVSGVWDWDPEYNIPKTSVSMGTLTQGDQFLIEILGRSSGRRDQERLIAQVKSYFKLAGFHLDIPDIFWPWEEDINDFAKSVLDLGAGIYEHMKFVVVHGGAEPLVFKDLFPEVETVSIGPEIFFPHSNRECVSVKAIDRATRWVDQIMTHFNQ